MRTYDERAKRRSDRAALIICTAVTLAAFLAIIGYNIVVSWQRVG